MVSGLYILIDILACEAGEYGDRNASFTHQLDIAGIHVFRKA